jgi:hypothetical protein
VKYDSKYNVQCHLIFMLKRHILNLFYLLVKVLGIKLIR